MRNGQKVGTKVGSVRRSIESPVDDPPGAVAGSSRVIRGESWEYAPTRSVYCGGQAPQSRDQYLGFRMALVQSDR